MQKIVSNVFASSLPINVYFRYMGDHEVSHALRGK